MDPNSSINGSSYANKDMETNKVFEIRSGMNGKEEQPRRMKKGKPSSTVVPVLKIMSVAVIPIFFLLFNIIFFIIGSA